MVHKSYLLVIDALINLALGISLAIFPRSLAEMLGIPIPMTPFYTSILGGVLTGIGIALLIERFRPSARISGLGLEGAIIINFFGAGTLVIWLVIGHLVIPVRGLLFLWMVAILVLGTTVIEIFSTRRQG
jgi:hypothetical protein